MIGLNDRPTRAKRVVVVQLKDKKPEPFLTCPEIYLKYDKENSKAYYLRGTIYMAQKLEEKAIRDFNQAVAFEKSDYELYILISLIAVDIISLQFSPESFPRPVI